MKTWLIFFIGYLPNHINELRDVSSRNQAALAADLDVTHDPGKPQLIRISDLDVFSFDEFTKVLQVRPWKVLTHGVSMRSDDDDR